MLLNQNAAPSEILNFEFALAWFQAKSATVFGQSQLVQSGDLNFGLRLSVCLPTQVAFKERIALMLGLDHKQLFNCKVEL